ncbi:DUF6350 family protein [Brevibacterium sp.]|uniref:cell division protein PerM n=1 Tax=Brevibacterium sp. TaxID=1701 RepID=UPI00281269CE|nr:DUF6350 family protein [Brevibacterium sp.]
MHTSPLPRTNRHPVLLGLLEAFRLDLIIVPVAFLLSAAFWLIGLSSQLQYSIIPEWALSLWAIVHGLSVSTIGFDFSLPPGLVTVVVWFLLASASRRLVESSVDDDEEFSAPDGWKSPVLALATFVLAYAGPLLTGALLFGETAMTPFGFLRFLLLLVSAVAAGWLWARGVDDLPVLRDLDPDTVDCARAVAKRIFWGLLAVTLIAIGIGTALRWDALTTSMENYSSPLSATIGLLVVQILFAPGILFSVLSWIAGSGVNLGAGGLSSVFHSVPGPVPDVPVLQLLPGDYPDWSLAAPALLVLVGLLSVVLGRAHAQSVLIASWTGIGLTALIVFVLLQLLALIARGAMGPLGLSDFGPSALTSAAAVTAWVGLGLSAGLALTKLSQLQYTGEADDDLHTADDRHTAEDTRTVDTRERPEDSD